MKMIKNNGHLNVSKLKKSTIVKCSIAALGVVLLMGVTKQLSADDSMNQDNFTLAEQLMKEVNPIGTTIFGSIEKAVVYLDVEGNVILATSDYQILECNGMDYTHIGYIFANENGAELFYKKEDVDVIQLEETNVVIR